MSNVVKYTLIAIGLNILLALVLFIPVAVMDGDAMTAYLVFLLFFTPLSLLVQLIVGIVFAAGEKKKEIGKGILLSVGFFLLVGLSICGPMWTGL